MIPDKIYIDVGTISSNVPGECYALPGWHEKPSPKMASEEYIRKDALLEWINEKRIEFLPGNDDISGVKAHSHLTRSILLDSFEQKINSL